LTIKHYETKEKFAKLRLIKSSEFTYERDRNYPKHLVTINNFGINENDLNDKFVDLAPYIQISSYVSEKYTPLHKVYKLFRGLGLK